MSSIRPIKTKVILAAIEKKQQSASGLIIEGSFGDAQYCRVLAIGPDVTDVSVGDTVFPTWNACKIVKADEGERLVIDQKDIIMIVE